MYTKCLKRSTNIIQQNTLKLKYKFTFIDNNVFFLLT